MSPSGGSSALARGLSRDRASHCAERTASSPRICNARSFSTPPHVPVVVELPQFVAIAAVPLGNVLTEPPHVIITVPRSVSVPADVDPPWRTLRPCTFWRAVPSVNGGNGGRWATIAFRAGNDHSPPCTVSRATIVFRGRWEHPSRMPAPNSLIRAPWIAIGKKPVAEHIGGSACGYREPFALCGSHGHPARPAAALPYVYASARFGRPSSFAADRAALGNVHCRKVVLFDDAFLPMSVPGKDGLHAPLTRPRCSPYWDRSWRGRRGCSPGAPPPTDSGSCSTRIRSPC